jgi:signal transduction histidine kinase/ligand-binding sensor domain-containing protein
MRIHFHSNLCTLLLTTFLSPAFAQEVRFKKVTIPDEIAFGVIGSITQDPQGYIWFGMTNNGLVQYDGKSMKKFTPDAMNPHALTSPLVESICADKAGNIWVGTYGDGLEKYDPKTGKFSHFRHNPKDPLSLSGDTVTCVLEDREGFIWVGTQHNGLNRLDPKSGNFLRYQFNEKDPQSLSFDQVRVIYEDKKGDLWIGTGGPFVENQPGYLGGLNRLHKATGKFTRYLHKDNDPHSLIDNRVRAILEDSHGNFWVGTAGDGLHTMNREKGSFERHTYDPDHPEKLSRPALGKFLDYVADHITFIKEDGKGVIWIGTMQAGLMSYDPATGKIRHYNGRKGTAGNFTDSTTWSAYISRDGVMWLSAWFGEFYRFDPSHQDVYQEDLSTNGGLFAFLEEPGGIQWFGTGNGLIRKDIKNNTSTTFRHDPKNPESIGSNYIDVLYKDSKNRLWAGGNSLSLWNPDKQSFTVFRHGPNSGKNLSGAVVLALIEDDDAHVWVGTDAGFDRMDVEKGEFTQFKAFPEEVNGQNVSGLRNAVSSLFKDTQQNLWIGHFVYGGLHKRNPHSGQLKHYLDGELVYQILEDHEHKIWVGTSNALYKYDHAADSFLLFIDPATDRSMNIYTMVEDNDHNLWTASSLGICRINKDRTEVTRFQKDFNINHRTLRNGIAGKTTDGQLIFANVSGYYSIYPEKMIRNKSLPEIILSDFKIGNQRSKIKTSIQVTEDVLAAKQFTLPYHTNDFSFQFSIIHYSNPDANKAMYMLENYEDSWRPAGSDYIAYYYNIPPGRYRFRIKAASSYGVWAEKDFDVIITPPWWRTWWAYAIYGLLFIGLAYSIHRTLRQRVIMAERERTRVRELAQAREIEKAYHELKTTQAQLIQSEKMASLGELTAGIAHEIQNPLNFINNFSEINKELLVEMSDELERKNYDEARVIAQNVVENQQKINHHGKRADAIVKGMLQHSQSNSSKKEPTDINALADEYLRLAYHGLRAKDKSFNAAFKTDFDPSIGQIDIVPQDIGRVLLNLYNNAFYAVAEKQKQAVDGYEPTVSVRTAKLDGEVQIIVADNGNGIPETVKDKVFQPFFTTKPTGQGTGLGLSLSYDIIKAHQGKITIKNSPGAGAEFLISLPV